MSSPRKKSLFYSLFNFVNWFILSSLTLIVSLFNRDQRNYLPPIDNHLLLLPAIEATKKIKTGQIKCEDLIGAYIDRIKKVNGHINAIIDERFDLAIEEARAVDRQVNEALRSDNHEELLAKPLLGIPVTIKDSIAVKGMLYTGGFFRRKGARATEDAPLVQNLRRAGAIIIGITNVPEMLFWWDSVNNLYGATMNPYDKSRVCGGSSGGEGSILGSAGSVVGVGSDLVGSIRCPAYFCGVYGHKPTSGIISKEGFCMQLSRTILSMYTPGPMTRYACDLRPMLTTLAGVDGIKLLKDNLIKPVDLRKLKIYYVEDDGECAVHPENWMAVKRVVRHFKKINLTVKKVQLDFRYAVNISLCNLGCNSDSPSLAQYMSQEIGQHISHCHETNIWLELLKKLIGRSQHNLYLIFMAIVEKILYKMPTYAEKLLDIGDNIKQQFIELVGDEGVLVLPSFQSPPPKRKAQYWKMNDGRFMPLFNVINAPVTQVPLGLTRENFLPMGVQIAASPFNDHLTIAVAEELERAFGGWIPPCHINI